MDHCPRCGSDQLVDVNWMHDDDQDIVQCESCGFTWSEGSEEAQEEGQKNTSD